MPRKVDYASRFQFLREAAFAIVLRDGVGALSRRALAAELSTSRNRVDDLLREGADLRSLAAAEVTSRRRTGRFGRSDGGPLDLAVTLVRNLVPDTEARIPEELVWLRLVADLPSPVSDQDPDGPLWMRYQIAQRGYVYAPRPDPDGQPTSDERDSQLTEHVSGREDLVDSALHRALDSIGVDDEQHGACSLLRALVDGITLSVCRGRLTPADGVSLLRAHLTSIAGQCRPPG